MCEGSNERERAATLLEKASYRGAKTDREETRGARRRGRGRGEGSFALGGARGDAWIETDE